MKTVLALLTVGVMQPCVGSPFVNLTFDEPDLTGSLTPIYPGGPLEGDAALILNGWSLVVNGGIQTMMAYSPHGTSTAGLATLFENSPAEQPTILGSHSLLLRSPFPSQPDIRIRQTGTIPVDAVGLWIGSAGRIEGFINGQKIGEIDPFLGSDVVLDVTRATQQIV